MHAANPGLYMSIYIYIYIYKIPSHKILCAEYPDNAPQSTSRDIYFRRPNTITRGGAVRTHAQPLNTRAAARFVECPFRREGPPRADADHVTRNARNSPNQMPRTFTNSPSDGTAPRDRAANAQRHAPNTTTTDRFKARSRLSVPSVRSEQTAHAPCPSSQRPQAK